MIKKMVEAAVIEFSPRRLEAIASWGLSERADCCILASP